MTKRIGKSSEDYSNNIFGGTFGEEFVEPKGGSIVEEKDWLDISNFKPEEVNDENSFKPLKGAYVCRIEKLEHKTGESKEDKTPYDFYALKMQVVETLEGDKGTNRFLDRTYQGNADGIKKLLTDMFNANIELDRSSPEALEQSFPSAKDKLINVRTWIWTPDKDRAGNTIPEEDRKQIQQMKIVKSFKLGKGGKSDNVKKSDEVPF